MTQKSESEKQSLERIVSDKENDIFNLKHRINEEIEDKTIMTIQYSDDITKLNNEINELEQKLKDNNNQCRLIVEIKMQEIQTLQEEKLSLLQSLNDETTKLENDIKSLQSELDAERNSKVRLREEYENHIMKLNEKVLNRNNELVELQNNVFEKSEQMEALFLELRKEKQARDELVAKHRNELDEINEKLIYSEKTAQEKCREIENLVEKLNYNLHILAERERALQDAEKGLSERNNTCRMLEETKVKLLEELTTKSYKIEELHKNIENLINIHREEKDKLSHDLDSAHATLNTLQMQLQDELQFKIGLQNEYANLEHAKTLLINEIQQQKGEINKLQQEVQDKDKTIDGMDLFLQEEKHINQKMKLECQQLTKNVQKMSEDITIIKNEFEHKLIYEKNSFDEEICKKDEVIQILKNKLSAEIEEKANLELMLNNEKDQSEKQLLEIKEQQKKIDIIKAEIANATTEKESKCCIFLYYTVYYIIFLNYLYIHYFTNIFDFVFQSMKNLIRK